MTQVATKPLPTRQRSVLPVLLVVLAVGQLIAPIFPTLFGGAFTTADRAGEPTIVPAGYTFSIWFVIEVLSLGYALWAVSDRRPDPELRHRLALPLAVLFAGFSVWLVAAEVEPTWSTLVVFVVMLVAVLKAMQIALDHREQIERWSPLGRLLLWGTLGLYTGWGSVAIWFNLTTALTASGAPIDGVAGFVGQLAILAGVTGTAVVILVWTSGLLPYAAAVTWALVGSVIGSYGAGAPGLAVAAAVGLLVVLATTAALRLRTRRSRTLPS